MPPLPETARLTLRRFTADDLEWVTAINADPDVMRLTGGVMTPEQSRAMVIDRMLPYYDEHPGLGSWVTRERNTGAIIGFHILNHLRGEPDIQVGYRLYQAYWGRGYATEMTVGLMRYGFAGLGLDRICAITDRDHLVSQRVLVKSGLEPRGLRHLDHPSYAPANPLAWFQIERDAWLAAHPDPSVS